jgi:hypothetical protein
MHLVISSLFFLCSDAKSIIRLSASHYHWRSGLHRSHLFSVCQPLSRARKKKDLTTCLQHKPTITQLLYYTLCECLRPSCPCCNEASTLLHATVAGSKAFSMNPRQSSHSWPQFWTMVHHCSLVGSWNEDVKLSKGFIVCLWMFGGGAVRSTCVSLHAISLQLENYLGIIVAWLRNGLVLQQSC